MTTTQKTCVSQGRDYKASRRPALYSSISWSRSATDFCTRFGPFFTRRFTAGAGCFTDKGTRPFLLQRNDGIIRQYPLLCIEREACAHLGATSGAAGRGGRGAFAAEVV